MRRLALVLLVAACGDSGAGGGPDAGPAPLIVGVSWNNYQQPRWALLDEPALRAAIEAAGATYIATDANLSADQQLTDVQSLLDQGADVLVVLAQDAQAVRPAVQMAFDRGVPVLAYDRLIEDERTFYLSFDNLEVGRMEARGVFAAAPTGSYVIIKGDPGDPNSDLLRIGHEEVLHDALTSGAITIVGEAYTDGWRTEAAQSNMEGFLAANDNQIDAVIAENDSTALGVVAALDVVGLAGLVPVSGQDGDPANLNLIARGLQTVSVWKDARDLGTRAGEIAVALARGTAPADIPGAGTFVSPAGSSLHAILLTPVPITRDNLDIPLDAGWISVEDLCAGVAPGSVPVCP